MILDEATASMDAENENLVQQAPSVLLQGKTVLVIAHRMRTIANVDKVVVLEQGRVAETGRPEELLKKKGLFLPSGYGTMWTAIAPPPGKFCFEYDLSIQFVLFTNLYAPIRVLLRTGAFCINLSDLLLIFRRMELKKSGME